MVATIGFLVAAEIELTRLQSENSQLSERLETWKLVERAKGILPRDLGISEQEAYLASQRQSRLERPERSGVIGSLERSNGANGATGAEVRCWPPAKGRREGGTETRETHKH